MSRGQGQPDARELTFPEGFVGTDLPIVEELEGVVRGVTLEVYRGLERLFRGRPGWSSMRQVAEWIQQDHARVVEAVRDLEALHLIRCDRTSRGSWFEVLPLSPQALVALRQRAEQRLGPEFKRSRRAERRQAQARAQLGLPRRPPQPPTGGRAASDGRHDHPKAASAPKGKPARRPPPSQAPTRGGDGGEPDGPLPPSSPGRPVEAEPRAASRQAPQPEAEPASAGVVEPTPAPPLRSPEPLADRQPDGEPVSQPSHPATQPVAAQEPAAPKAVPELMPAEPAAASRPDGGPLASEPAVEPAAVGLAPAQPAEAPGPGAPAAEGQPAEAPSEDGQQARGEASDEPPVAKGVTEEAAELGAVGGEWAQPPQAPAAGELQAPGVAEGTAPSGAGCAPPSGAHPAPPEEGAPNYSLDPFVQIPPSLPSPTPARGASQPDGGREESLAPPAAEPASQPTAAASSDAQPQAPEPPASDHPALEALGVLVTLACSLWPHKLQPSAVERWLSKALALVEPAPSRGEMAAFLRWAAEEESLAKAKVPLAAALSPGRFVPWITRRRDRLQPLGAAAPPCAIQAAREAELRAAREARLREEKFARAARFAHQPAPSWPRFGPKAAATPAPGAPVATPAPRPAGERAQYDRAFSFLPAELRAEGLSLLGIPHTERTDLQRQRFTRLQQLAMQAEARRELTSSEATEGAARGAESEQ